MIKVRGKLVAISAALACGAATLVPMSSALAYISPPLVLLGEAQGPASLVASGAAVDVPVEYTCNADSMYIGVSLSQAAKKGMVASGSGSTVVPCDARTHRVLVRVRADASGVAFAKGNAAAGVDVFGCYTKGGKSLCGDDTTERTIKLKK